MTSEAPFALPRGGFFEGLRWHDGELWYSDMVARRVRSVSAGGVVDRAHVPGQPSGIGWSVSGEPVVASMLDGLVVTARPAAKRIVADLCGHHVGPVNDVLSDGHGRLYVGSLGFDPSYGGLDPGALSPAEMLAAVTLVPLVLVEPDGSIREVASGLAVPNGMALIDGGTVLVVAETVRQQLTAFTVLPDGSLTDRRVFATLPAPVDGICADRDGAIWASQLSTGRFVRVLGGEMVDEVTTPGAIPIACVLGGPTGHTLFMSVVRGEFDLWGSGHVDGAIEATTVAVPAW